MGDKLTKQDAKFVEKVIETGNLTKSAQEAYKIKNYGYARVKGSEQLTKPNIQNAIRTLAERIPDELLEEKHLALLNKLDKEGNIDVQAVSKGLDMAYKIKGAYEEDGSSAPKFIPVLVQFIKENDNETSDNRNTD